MPARLEGPEPQSRVHGDAEVAQHLMYPGCWRDTGQSTPVAMQMHMTQVSKDTGAPDTQLRLALLGVGTIVFNLDS